MARETVGTILIAYAIFAAAALLLVRRQVAAGPVGWLLLLSFSGLLYVLAFSPGTRFLLGYVVIPPAYLAAVVVDGWHLPALPLILPLVAAVVSIRAFTNANMETAFFTQSALRFCLIGLVAAASIAVAFFARSALLRLPRPSISVAGAFAVAACLVAVLFFTANFDLMPTSAPFLYSLRHADYGAVLITPPAITSLPADQLIRQTTNDVTYVLPPKGTYQCWATIPCAPFPLPSDVRLLDPRGGIEGGLRRR
jgi:hypothetical protein